MLTSASVRRSSHNVRPCAYTVHDFDVPLEKHLQTDPSMQMHSYIESVKAQHLLRGVTYDDGWSA